MSKENDQLNQSSLTSKPKSMTVFSVLNFVFATLYILTALFGLVMSSSMMSNPLSPLFNGSYKGALLMLISSLLSLCLGAVGIVSGIGLIKVASWARGWLLAFAVLTILISIINAFLSFAISEATATPISQSTYVFWVGVVTSISLQSIYPVLLLVFLNNTKWKDAFAANS